MGYDIIQETVPSFTRRVGDQVFQGSNNTIIIMGTDRAKDGPATIDDGVLEKGTGTIHMIAGRNSSDPDFDKDKAFLYISSKTKVDDNLSLTGVESTSNDVAAAVLKSDSVRLVFRKDIKIAFDGGKNYIHIDKDGCTIKIDSSYFNITSDTITVDSKTLKLGKNSVNHILESEAFLQKFDGHQHPTGVGTSGPPIEPLTPQKDTMSTTGGSLGKPEINIP